MQSSDLVSCTMWYLSPVSVQTEFLSTPVRRYLCMLPNWKTSNNFWLKELGLFAPVFFETWKLGTWGKFISLSKQHVRSQSGGENSEVLYLDSAWMQGLDINSGARPSIVYLFQLQINISIVIRDWCDAIWWIAVAATATGVCNDSPLFSDLHCQKHIPWNENIVNLT
jgi:hypothetical protein